jgi:KDO II ethanolaminephosphotransferase
MYKKWQFTPLTISITVTVYLWLLNMIANQSIEKSYLAILPAWFFLLAALFFSLLHRWIFKLFIGLNILLASVTIFFKWRYQVTITEDIILSGMMNDLLLTVEMLSLPLVLWVVLMAFVPIYLLNRLNMRKSSLRRRFASICVVFLLIVTTVYIQGYEYRAKGQIRDYKSIQAIGSFSPLDIVYAYKKARKADQKLTLEYMEAKQIHKRYKDKEPNNDQLIVLIVGESTRGDHLSLNGYPRETTPRLKKIDNLYSFRRAKSCDTLTLRSMHYMFSPLACDSTEGSVSEAAFTEVFRSLSYQVEIYSLQTLNAFYHYLGYDTLISKYAVVNEQTTGTRDASLLPYIQKSIASYHEGKRLIIVHTLGSHQSYFDRTSVSQETFKPACHSADVALCAQEALINSYDNTIVAIDTFITSIVGMLSQKNAMLIYLSDHGESLGENGFFFHGKPRDIAPKEQFMIPFFFWFSESYSQRTEVGAFKNWVETFSLDANVSHDYLFHSILGCSGIVSDNGGIDERFNFCRE